MSVQDVEPGGCHLDVHVDATWHQPASDVDVHADLLGGGGSRAFHRHGHVGRRCRGGDGFLGNRSWGRRDRHKGKGSNHVGTFPVDRDFACGAHALLSAKIVLQNVRTSVLLKVHPDLVVPRVDFRQHACGRRVIHFHLVQVQRERISHLRKDLHFRLGVGA